MNDQKNECTVTVKNAKSKDSGIWKFSIGAIYGQNYKELEQNHEVAVSNEGKKMKTANHFVM